ncbi:T9SS type A sorting domain-containing protein, partial [bacterium]|nr:T9SS type A sorting domain-containing protein [bacterium]
QATYYGNSDLYDINYVIGESLSVFYDDAVDCDIFIEEGPRDLTINGGEDPVMGTFWPLVDIYGLRLHDDDVVQLIWAGPDTLMDTLDEFTGMPTGDDSVLVEFGIGEGLAGEGTGRFKLKQFTYETHTKGGYPAQGDVLYLRVFEAPSIGEGSEAMWYGESETYTVQWAFDEEFYSFPDSVFDATTRVPWYRTIKIYGGLDSAMTEYPLTDNDGDTLEDGDLVQILWAGPDDLLSPMDSTGSPTGDDSLLTTLIIGDGYGDGTGLFKTELQTFYVHKGGVPAEGDFIFVRVFDSTGVNLGHYYGESDLHEVAFEQGELFFCFSDSTDDTVIPNPAIIFVEEWTTPTATLPTEYTLFQNYPNPFNPETDIQYQIPEGCQVQLSIYNVLGQEIYTLVDGERAAGKYTVRWFGTDSHGRELSSGIYFYRLKAGDFVDVRKMVLLK